MEERVGGRKGTKRCLHYRLDIGRIQDDESVDGHLSRSQRGPWVSSPIRSLHAHYRGHLQRTSAQKQLLARRRAI
jgi:hypothetical protein